MFKKKGLFATAAAILLMVAGPAQAVVIDSYHQAVKEFGADARRGDLKTQIGLALAAMQDEKLSVKERFTESYKWFLMAAKQGNPQAQMVVGSYLFAGNYVGQDFVQARYWLKKAAEQGMDEAQYTYGVMLLQGLGGEQNIQEGVKWLEKAAKQGYKHAVDVLKMIEQEIRNH